MAASRKAARNTPSKTKAVRKAITRSSSNHPRHDNRSVATAPTSRDTGSDLVKETLPTYLDCIRDLEDRTDELERSDRRKQYRVRKPHTRRRRRHHHSSESSSDSEEDVGPTKSFMGAEAETRGHRSAKLGGEPPQSWYSQIALPREVARPLWWGSDAKIQKAYFAVERTYGVHCTLNGISPCLPATMKSLASWIAELGNQGVKIESIKVHLARIRSVHESMWYDNLGVFDSATIQRIMDGICRRREFLGRMTGIL